MIESLIDIIFIGILISIVVAEIYIGFFRPIEKAKQEIKEKERRKLAEVEYQKAREKQEQERIKREQQEKARKEQEQREKEAHREQIEIFAELLRQADESWQQEGEWREKDQQWERLEHREKKRLITALIRILFFETERRIGLFEIDKMEGHQFEYYCASLLRKLNFSSVEVTKGSGDQGVDIVATKEGVRYAIQCKRYSSVLGNSPVQEVNAGKQLYHCHVAVVLTNQHFTAGAKQLAAATGVLLWDREKLIDMIKQANKVA